MEKNKYNEEEELKDKASQEEYVMDSSEETADYDKLLEQNNELNDKNLRLMAEFDNYRKRSLKERADLLKTAGEKILVDMLPLVDDFERAIKAMESTNDIEAVKEGVNLIYHKFISFLAQNGVTEIPTENEAFDTDVHEAVTTFPATCEDDKGKIIDCVSKGYKLNDKVIRFPKVVVGE